MAPYQGGVVLDIGTGDGRFVSRSARANPIKFFIGIDANVKPLEKPSMKATRNPNRGGLPNVLFVQAAVEDLPDELNGLADEIHVHFPWGSLLKAAVEGNEHVLRSFERIAAPGCMLEVVMGLDVDRDRSEIVRLGLPVLDDNYIVSVLIGKYRSAGFEIVDHGELDAERSSKIEMSWARRLSRNDNREVRYFLFRRF